MDTQILSSINSTIMTSTSDPQIKVLYLIKIIINTAQKETTPLKVDHVTFKRYIIQ